MKNKTVCVFYSRAILTALLPMAKLLRADGRQSRFGFFATTLVVTAGLCLGLLTSEGAFFKNRDGDSGEINSTPVGDATASEEGPFFDDLVGGEGVREKVEWSIAALKTPKLQQSLGRKGSLPGIIFHGPEGTGKRTAAKAIAQEVGASFREIDMEEVVLWDTEDDVEKMFEEADSSLPLVVFVGKADSFLPDSFRTSSDDPLASIMKTSTGLTLAKSKSSRSLSSGDVEKAKRNELLLYKVLKEFDKASMQRTPFPNILLIVSTRRKLSRPQAIVDRFSDVEFRNPDTKLRRKIFRRKLEKLPTVENSALLADTFARKTHGLNGKDISRICERALMNAASRDNAEIEVKVGDVEESVEKEKELKPVLREWERQTVAYHEAGHAVVSWKLKHADEMLAVSIVPDSDGALGYTQYNNKNSVLHTNEQVFAKMCVALAGRYSEQFFMKRLTTGARDDLQKVTALAYYSVATYGFDKNFVSYDDLASFRRIYGEDVASQIDADVKAVVSRASEIAKSLVKQHWDSVDKVASTLLERDTLTYRDMQGILGPSAFIPKGDGDVGTSQLPPPVAANESQGAKLMP